MNASKKLALIGISTITVMGCKSISKVGKDICEKSTFVTEPKVLEVHGDSVEYQTKVTIPAKVFHKKAILKIEPVVKPESGKSSSRPPVTIGGGKQKRTKTTYTITPKEGGTVVIKDKFAYDPSMKNIKLEAQNSLTFENKFPENDQCKTVCPKDLASGFITTSQKLENGQAVQTKDEYKPVEKKISTDIYYLINSSTLNPKFKIGDADVDNAEELKEFGKIISNDSMALKGITVNSYASPDGPKSGNERLAKARAEATNKYVKQQLNKAGVKEVNDSAFYHSYSVTENWQGWKEEVAKSDLPDKDAILAIMNSSIDDEAKEMRIKREHAASYDKMRTTILPRLRKSEIVFGSAASMKTDAELLVAGKQSLDNLSKDEEMQYGKLVTDNDERRRTYAHFVNKYPEDWRGYNNLAAALLTAGEFDEAKKNLDQADKLNPNNPYVKNNLGLYYIAKKDYDEAIKNFEIAKSNGDLAKTASYNTGVVYAKKGDYKSAIDAFGSEQCRYNVGLTYMLNKDYDLADKSLKCVPEADRDADYYYIAAVLGARQKNFDAVAANLKRAIELNSSYKGIGKADLEFREYAGRSDFEAIFK